MVYKRWYVPMYVLIYLFIYKGEVIKRDVCMEVSVSDNSQIPICVYYYLSSVCMQRREGSD